MQERGPSQVGAVRVADPGAFVLGVSADYHDAAAALVADGAVVAAAAEERFTRTKHDPDLPVHAIAWCLESAGVAPGALDAVAFYSKPMTAYERILVTGAAAGPRGFRSLARAVGVWSARKLWVRERLDRTLRRLGHRDVRVVFAEHHLSHAASAFYPSPFESAAILTFDGVGEWATTSLGHGREGAIDLVEELVFPNSLGLFYSAMTAFCGFEVNDGEYKLMGLAPYGEPRYVDRLLDEVVRIDPHGGIQLDQRWFDYQAGERMTRPALAGLLDGPERGPDEELGQRHADIAASAQVVLERGVVGMARRARRATGERSACLAGGVALNCVANRALLDAGVFDALWVQPAAGDDGGALGAALWAWHVVLDGPRTKRSAGQGVDAMSGAFLGPSFAHEEVRRWLDANQVVHEVPADPADEAAAALARGELVGWFRGEMEFGPRSLGHRAILADPRDPTVAGRLNAQIKQREGFRPFAPAVALERAGELFDLDGASPYMLFTAPVKGFEPPSASPPGSFAERLAAVRSPIPACTHVDGSSRVQTVDAAMDPAFHRLITAFAERSGLPVVLNTSFNRAGEPIVRTPADALRTAAAVGLDVLVLEGCVVRRPTTIPGVEG